MTSIEKALFVSTTTTTTKQTSTTAVSPVKTHEQLLDEKLNQVITSRKNPFNLSKGKLISLLIKTNILFKIF